MKPKNSSLKTFSKKWVSRIMTMAILDIQLSYVLAFIGKEQIAETLSITIVTEVVTVMAAYFLKSYFETRQSEITRLREKRMDTEERNERHII